MQSTKHLAFLMHPSRATTAAEGSRTAHGQLQQGLLQGVDGCGAARQQVEVFVGAFFDVVLLQLVVACGRNAVAGQCAFHADQRAAIERNDGAARARGFS